MVNKSRFQGEEESPTSLATEDAMSTRGKDYFRVIQEWKLNSGIRKDKGEELNIVQVQK